MDLSSCRCRGPLWWSQGKQYGTNARIVRSGGGLRRFRAVFPRDSQNVATGVPVAGRGTGAPGDVGHAGHTGMEPRGEYPRPGPERSSAGHAPGQRKPRDSDGVPGCLVEMGGIEPPSDGRPRGLLRAQSASYFSAPDVMQTCLPDGLSQLSVEVDPLTRSTTSGSLNDARIRAGSATRADGLKVQTAIRQQERSRCDSVRHLFGLHASFTS